MTDNNYREIVKLNLNKLISNLNEKNIELTYSDTVINYILTAANCTQAHAREISKTISNEIENKIVDFMIENMDTELSAIHLSISDNNELKVNSPVFSSLK